MSLGIQVSNLSKSFGRVHAVDDLSFVVEPGRVTGFLGPNGAGKTTTLRMLLGLARANSGTATFDGRRYTDFRQPARHIGAALEASSFHPGRTARDHLRLFAPAAGAGDARCDELLSFLGLEDAANRRVQGFSTGMRQRLSLATALLGDPEVLILDEPTNGLDPEGIAWLRTFLRNYAESGRTVLVSSHVLSEVQQSVDDVVIIARGRLVHESALRELHALAEPAAVVSGPDPDALRAALQATGWPVTDEGAGTFRIAGVRASEVGHALYAARVEIHRLEDDAPSLEETFLRLVDGPPQSHHHPATAQDGRAGE
ncbi:ABC transporter ATP-binding protein [Rarobacter faecitabidus]|uniref:ABC-2 type transport system ATP-binding protein n=1 Tax=Rarobacter faecitabidus TaxID=13243 RepID=A0A542ZTV7_RARFA|nr:ABC transporter ATP-binding protein [Rarobacter faecitabidus]TQL63785.1 ABC-2 type transport system ATP-binding protein [Rarobacter faecitabidus]